MIQKIQIQNFKSIVDLTLDLGRVTVLIGENGAGKSNILEAIAFLSVLSHRILGDEFLASRGIRLPTPSRIISNFDSPLAEFIAITLTEQFNETVTVTETKAKYDDDVESWRHSDSSLPMNREVQETLDFLLQYRDKISMNIRGGAESHLNQTGEDRQKEEVLYKFFQQVEKISTNISKDELSIVGDFLIYSPEYRALRIFDEETQIRPLGINGAGLFRLVKKISQENPDALQEIRQGLQLLDWFEDLEMPTNLFATERYLNIKDRYIDETMDYFDQRSTNEGFVFLLFYLTLFVSKETPAFFAIDNIDASLNPKLCRRLMSELVKLAKKYDKQVILTTHNPGLLDGLNLHDDEQRLLVVSRNLDGHTKVRRIEDKRNLEEQVRLSEAFLRGYLGGLPKNF